MAKFLADDEVWREIRRQAARSKSLTAVVAYLGTRPDRLLKWPRRSVLVADLSEATVAQGSSSAKGALRLVRRVRLYHADGLHAKCYLFDRAAIVASANLSSSGLREAGVLLSAPHELKTIKAYVHRILRNALPMDQRLLNARARLEPKRQNVRRARRRIRGFPWGDRVWVIAAHEDDEEMAAERRAKARWSEAEGYERNSLQWFNDCGLKIYQQVSERDVVFFWEFPTTRRPLGYIAGPFVSRGGVDLDRRLRKRRYALAVEPRSFRTVTLVKGNLSRLRAIVGYGKHVTHGEAPERVEVPFRRIGKLARLVGVPLSNGRPRR